MKESRAPDLSATAYWKAVATLSVDRRQALADIERFFADHAHLKLPRSAH